MEDVITIISQVGFPIGIAIIAFYMYWKFVSQQMEMCAKREEALMAQSVAREEKLGAQLDKFSESLNNFNISLTKIDARLQTIEKSIEK
jgi:hypothetical protein